jgi:hypothetical protein
MTGKGSASVPALSFLTILAFTFIIASNSYNWSNRQVTLRCTYPRYSNEKKMLKYFSYVLIVLLVFTLGCCSSTSCAYEKWVNAVGWSKSIGESSELPNISFEYPNRFQMVTKAIYNQYFHMTYIGGMEQQEYHIINYSRPINQKDDLQTSFNHGSLSTVYVTVHTSDSYTRYVSEYQDTPTNNETALESILSTITPLAESEKIKKQLVIENNNAYSIKYSYHTITSDEPYNYRTIIITLFEYKSMVIEISMDSWEKESEEIEQYYNHLVRTFKIIE